ncbi:MAG: RNA polymerase sigma factor [Solirubrobacterales bacterium]
MTAVICGPSRDAKSVVRVAFYNAWTKQPHYSPGAETPRQWLFGIVREHAAHVHSGDELWGLSEFTSDELTSFLDMDERLSDGDIGDDVVTAIALALADAPDDQREVIALAFFGQLSPAEIANHLHLSPEVVQGRVRLGLDHLRARAFSP